ncbi:MAG: hypothetical protein LUC24_00890 [Bacteroidales bacterium]|nr:hypothetical protein [Bacteroidales bacterium]
MKHSVLYFALFALSFALGGCLAEDLMEVEPTEPGECPIVGEYVNVHLTLDVGDVYVSSTRSEEPDLDNPEKDTDAERHVDAVWVFQFDASSLAIVNGGAKLIEITDQKDLLDLSTEGVLVTNDGSPSIVYVVANVGNTNWVSVGTGFTLNDLLGTTIPNPDPIYVDTDGNPASSIPMGGRTEGSIIIKANARIIVPVYRMFAKLMVSVAVDVGDQDIEATPTALDIGRVANTCTVGTLFTDDVTVPTYPDDTKFLPWSFSIGSDYNPADYFIIYVPENIQGETSNTEVGNKSAAAPANALMVTTHLNLIDEAGAAIKSDPQYTVYPGGNVTNNFNIRRNCVYRISVSIQPSDIISPSANCLVASVGELFAFYPYERDETGHRDDAADKGADGVGVGYYDFENHLTYKDDALTINGVKIIWQTPDAIGDNSEHDKVYLSGSGRQTKIYVQTAKEGNALIAAYNNTSCTGDVLWSWHIWITDSAPDDVSNAITYSHYNWNSNGIQTDTRVTGYPVMDCNLGALSSETGSSWDEYTRTYGMLYQWGRKDPFPPVKTNGKKQYLYNYDNTTGNVNVNDNSNDQIYLTGNDGANGSGTAFAVFNTVMTTDIEQTQAGGIEYSIHNPTIFIASCIKLSGFLSSIYNSVSSYSNQGDWLPGGDDDLWGGNGTSKKKYTPYNDLNASDSNERFIASIEDNYGDYKTIFDPCPYGWRTAPGDLWLGFTKDGLNYNSSSKGSLTTMHDYVNCSEETVDDVGTNMGYHMYMNGWHTGVTSFFPTQGSRLASGQPAHGGICGNYHNATVDDVVDVLDYSGSPVTSAIRRVDIIHFHYDVTGYLAQVNPFEKELIYYNRAVAGPLRCVRDTQR